MCNISYCTVMWMVPLVMCQVTELESVAYDCISFLLLKGAYEGEIQIPMLSGTLNDIGYPARPASITPERQLVFHRSSLIFASTMEMSRSCQ